MNKFPFSVPTITDIEFPFLTITGTDEIDSPILLTYNFNSESFKAEVFREFPFTPNKNSVLFL